MSHKDNKEDFNRTACKSVAKSISEILQFSFDEEFRKQAFDLLKVSSTKQAELQIDKILSSMIEKENCENKIKKRKRTIKVKRKRNGEFDCTPPPIHSPDIPQPSKPKQTKNLPNFDGKPTSKLGVKNQDGGIVVHNSHGKNYYKLKFQESFSDGNSYLKNNLKIHHSCHF